MRHRGAVLAITVFLAAAPAARAERVLTTDTVTVGGVGKVLLPPVSDVAEANYVYNEALSAAATEGLERARALAHASGATLGGVEAIGGSEGRIRCESAAGERVPYTGVEPDFGEPERPIVVLDPADPPKTATPLVRSTQKQKRRRTHKALARTAEASSPTSCEVIGGLTLIFGLEAPGASGGSLVTADTVHLEGIGRVLLPTVSDVAEANYVYDEALTAAAADGLERARVVADASGAKLGGIEAISETPGSNVACKDAAGESVTYTGIEPDFGEPEPPEMALVPAEPKPAALPPARPKKKHKKRKTHKAIARKAQASTPTSCEVVGRLTLVYLLER